MPLDFAEAMSAEVAGVGAAFGVVVFAAAGAGVEALGFEGIAIGADAGFGATAVVAGATLVVFTAGAGLVVAVVVVAADDLADLAAAFFCALVCAGVVVVVVWARTSGCAKATVADRIVPSVTILMRFFFMAFKTP
jgi:hypothetical protein